MRSFPSTSTARSSFVTAWLDALRRDLRDAMRSFGSAPLVSVAIVLSLALGLACNMTIFTLVNAVFLRQLPVEEPERLTRISTHDNHNAYRARVPLSRTNVRDLRARADVLDEVVEVMAVNGYATAPGSPVVRVEGRLVTANYFTTLGVQAAHGRVFEATEAGLDGVPSTAARPAAGRPADAGGATGPEPPVVLSHRFWQRLGGHPGILGTSLELNRRSFTVIGIVPVDFPGTDVLAHPGFWAPIATHPVFLEPQRSAKIHERRAVFVNVLARLRPGVSFGEAASAVEEIGQQLAEQFPVANRDRALMLEPFTTTDVDAETRALYARAGGLLMAVAALVLLIACANAAHLLLGRAVARRREIGVRLALGAPRRRLLRQLLTESLVYAGLGGVLGVLLALWGRDLLWSLRPPALAESGLQLAFDGRVLTFSLALTVTTGLLFGLAPALAASRRELVGQLVRASLRPLGTGRLWNGRHVLVMGQVALSLVALVGSGLFLRSLVSAFDIDLGFEPNGTLLVDLDTTAMGWGDARSARYFEQAAAHVSRVPGVEAVGLTSVVPFADRGFRRTVFAASRAEDAEGNGVLMPVHSIDPGALVALGTELRSGRRFGVGDHASSEPVALVNAAAAARLWPGEVAIGKHFRFFSQTIQRRVVGVVDDIKYETVGETPRAQVYVPLGQVVFNAVTLVARGEDPATMVDGVVEALRVAEPAMPLGVPQLGTEAVAEALWPPRLAAILLAVLGFLAVVLAALGIAGVTWSSVRQREHEMSIRVAVGAAPDDVLRLVLGQEMRVVLVGLVAGLGVVLAAGPALGGLLYGVTPRDPGTLASASMVLLAVALVANLAPAWRATSGDPIAVLREER